MYMYPKVSTTVTKFDYRQELGILVQNCPILAQDAGKLFDVYWDLSHGKTAKIPKNSCPIFVLALNLFLPWIASPG